MSPIRRCTASFDNALYLVDMDVIETVRYVGRVAMAVLMKSCGIMILLALLDFMFVRWGDGREDEDDQAGAERGIQGERRGSTS